MITRPGQQLIDPVRDLANFTPELHLVALEPERALLPDDIFFERKAIDQRTKGPRTHFIGQARTQRFHIKAWREWLRAMMRSESVDRDPLEFIPLGGGGETLFVAERQLQKARIAQRRINFTQRRIEKLRDTHRR